jgi:hypothetical protein
MHRGAVFRGHSTSSNTHKGKVLKSHCKISVIHKGGSFGSHCTIVALRWSSVVVFDGVTEFTEG